MNKRLITGMLLITLFSSCQPHVEGGEAGDKELKMQVSKLKNEIDDGMLNYKVRLVLDKNMDIGKAEKESLYYKMDSCFYLVKHGKKTYADVVQPVANGVGGSYEYLVMFKMKGDYGDSVQLGYSDKYVNKKSYLLKLKK